MTLPTWLFGYSVIRSDPSLSGCRFEVAFHLQQATFFLSRGHFHANTAHLSKLLATVVTDVT